MTDEELFRVRLGIALGALEGLIRCAEDLRGKAIQLAPLDEGTLRGSSTVTLIVNGARFDGAGARAQATAAVTYLVRSGRPLALDAEVAFNTVYAARQHEELDWEHPMGGQAKYLEQPLLANSARYAGIIAAAARAGA